MELQKEFQEMIQEDISRIFESLSQGTDESRWELFREMDGKYQSCIKDFYEGMWFSIPRKNILHFPDLEKKPDYVVDNLKLVMAKLQTYRFGANAITLAERTGTNVSVTTNVNITVTFEQVRSQVKDMTSLTEEQTAEVLEKITEIESVISSTESKKRKWQQVRPVLVWLADKSFDIGMALLPLLLKLK